MPKDHVIKIVAKLNEQDGKWEIRINGVTSGVELYAGPDGDNMSMLFKLDCS